MTPLNDTFPDMAIEAIAERRPGAIKIGPFGSQLRKDEMVLAGPKIYGQENVISQDWGQGNRRVTDAKFRALSACRLDPGDVVLTMMGTLGKCAIFPDAAEPGLMDSHLLRIQPDPAVVDRSYLRLVIQAEQVVGRQVVRMSHGTIMSGLSSAIVRRLRIPVPPLPEQRHIAEILETVDQSIRRTEQLIAKLQLMNQGLLQSLFTRGIDDDGQLRDPESHRAQFKETLLGTIPSRWEVVKLGGRCRIRRGASPRPIDDPRWFASSGPGWVRIADVTRAQDRLEATTQYLSEAGAARSVSVTPGQVIMSIAATVGIAIVVGMDACIHDGFVVFDRHAETIDANFLALALQFYRPRFIKQGQTGTQANINTKIVESTLIALPGIEEQRRIICVNEALRAQDRAERLTMQKLRLLREGLVEDLLTGRVRVTPLLEGNAP